MNAQQNTVPLADKKMLTIPEVCGIANCGRSKLYQQIREGRLKITKCGRKTLVRPEALDAWINGLDR